ncbi:hypothetical protein Bhyg_12102 [Pseudolycoriella hygida]|uniref:Uncharacterized protein n=1 Tax=Pseudolycoriella hygida TaxID=35572 RepID=A0A9Q0S0V8_9DIPT|nr:hypothetical protein Bhyg_12102 [Pseudolycoriella hygida]
MEPRESQRSGLPAANDETPQGFFDDHGLG